jgi:hypothetical protein
MYRYLKDLCQQLVLTLSATRMGLHHRVALQHSAHQMLQVLQ